MAVADGPGGRKVAWDQQVLRGQQHRLGSRAGSMPSEHRVVVDGRVQSSAAEWFQEVVLPVLEKTMRGSVRGSHASAATDEDHLRRLEVEWSRTEAEHADLSDLSRAAVVIADQGQAYRAEVEQTQAGEGR
ncbi:MAG: hypothetical protein FWD18_07655 [Micrococcales bacterium]|nr:hypothetical protein [Micrococcales bacterium]